MSDLRFPMATRAHATRCHALAPEAEAERGDVVRHIADCAREGVVTPVFAVMNKEYNNAAMSRDHLAACLRGKEDAR